MIDIESFLQEFAKQYDDIPLECFKRDTLFKNNEEWSSMTAVCIIAMVDDKYRVKLTGDEIKKSLTIDDVFNIVSNKIIT